MEPPLLGVLWETNVFIDSIHSSLSTCHANSSFVRYHFFVSTSLECVRVSLKYGLLSFLWEIHVALRLLNASFPSNSWPCCHHLWSPKQKLTFPNYNNEHFKLTQDHTPSVMKDEGWTGEIYDSKSDLSILFLQAPALWSSTMGGPPWEVVCQWRRRECVARWAE